VERQAGRVACAGGAIGLEGRGHHRAPGLEVGLLEHGAPGGHEVAHRRDRLLLPQRRRQAGGDEVARVAGGLLDELGLSAGEVVVDRPPRSPRMLDHLREGGRHHALLAHERDGAGDHRATGIRCSCGLDYDEHHSTVGGPRTEGPMPLIDLTIPEGALAPDDRSALVDELTTVLLRAERAPDTDFFRSITWAYVHELPAGTVFAGGQPQADARFRVDITVPEGALSERRKQELVSEATRVVSAAAGLGEEDGLRVWVLITEVPEGNWGAAGNVVRFEQLREAAAQQREQAPA
jgi:phenylpyruvate tautomerase PptA (4-oxalocrotonate tautomerase family)